ncbi:hypothetical protein MKUB_54840 [Mycobacterium kubicae]|uniref:Uncharacterized protein n=1 Tax=Mycobacterium kubicae TaxID=120959 RepID=A0ABQ1BW84_9MYCO|nr:hypothetical protein MKUB_54840 [Mycobacterium kubicae]
MRSIRVTMAVGRCLLAVPGGDGPGHFLQQAENGLMTAGTCEFIGSSAADPKSGCVPRSGVSRAGDSWGSAFQLCRQCGWDHNVLVGLVIGAVEQGKGGFGEIAFVGDLPFVMGFDEDRAGESEQGGRVGNTPTTLVRRMTSLFNRSNGLVDQTFSSAAQGNSRTR